MRSTDGLSNSRLRPTRAARLACAMAIALGSASAIAAPQDCLIADLDGNGLVDEADLEIVRRRMEWAEPT